MAIGTSAPTTALNVATTPYLVLTSVLPITTTTVQLTTEATSTTSLQTTSVAQTTTDGITTSSFVSESTSTSGSTQTSSSSSESTLLLEIAETSQSTVIVEVTTIWDVTIPSETTTSPEGTSTVVYSTDTSQLTMSPGTLADDTERTDPWNPTTTSEELSTSIICRSLSLHANPRLEVSWLPSVVSRKTSG